MEKEFTPSKVLLIKLDSQRKLLTTTTTNSGKLNTTVLTSKSTGMTKSEY